MWKIKILILLILFLKVNFAFSQYSYSYSFAFKLYNNDEIVDVSKFCNEFTFANVYGHKFKLCKNNSEFGLSYDPVNAIYYAHISSIGSRFSIALYYKDEIMTLFFPFDESHPSYYFDRLDFKTGDFLFDLNDENLSNIKIAKDTKEFLKVESIDYIKLSKLFIESNYVGQDKIYK
ncbi:hypothetical protein M0M57_00510 [Flavobacterium azooxidireducens]|uniref:DUF4105 domain-containing protein n=1 Tax=Flavobacterium azooxidireducens TaxID=1871076 RepID=A0ABY4KEW3_9FLAO|nr:hypothetical protein [Flavobacterium azooxidireducens]UPQ79336.1 hypothetical protein M0M57_00510 [Flavobacterium azooxidireducens]